MRLTYHPGRASRPNAEHVANAFRAAQAHPTGTFIRGLNFHRGNVRKAPPPKPPPKKETDEQKRQRLERQEEDARKKQRDDWDKDLPADPKTDKKIADSRARKSPTIDKRDLWKGYIQPLKGDAINKKMTANTAGDPKSRRQAANDYVRYLMDQAERNIKARPDTPPVARPKWSNWDPRLPADNQAAAQERQAIKTLETVLRAMKRKGQIGQATVTQQTMDRLFELRGLLEAAKATAGLAEPPS
jgi:hypothetical protein